MPSPTPIEIAKAAIRREALSAAQRDTCRGSRGRRTSNRRAAAHSSCRPVSSNVGISADKKRDQPGPADAHARRQWRQTCVADDGGARQAAGDACVCIWRSMASGIWNIREPKPTRRKCFPTSCWCRCWHSIATGFGSDTARLLPISPSRRCARARACWQWASPSPRRKIAEVPKTPRDARLDLVMTEKEALFIDPHFRR